MDKRITDHLAPSRESFINDLRRLVEIDSVRTQAEDGKPFGEGGARVLEEAKNILSEHGYASENYDNYALEADLGAS